MLIVIQVAEDLIVDKGGVCVLQDNILTVMGPTEQRIPVTVITAGTTAAVAPTSKVVVAKVKTPSKSTMDRLTGNALRAARYLADHPGSTSRDAQIATGMKENSASAICSTMAQSGILSMDRANGRAAYTLTAKGKHLLAAADRVAREVAAHPIRPIPSGDAAE